VQRRTRIQQNFGLIRTVTVIQLRGQVVEVDILFFLILQFYCLAKIQSKCVYLITLQVHDIKVRPVEQVV